MASEKLEKIVEEIQGLTLLEASELVKLLEERLGLKVEFFDERLTTAEAERVLLEVDLSRRRRKEVRDELAAVLILQGYLDYRARAGAGEKEDER